ncbi:SUKH-4 family immunity protein [Kitasatospora griseola]|uniref:SUKH-4 family immunity protein n=2 Tax=Kitasatospora griseola TaxID=2064 RepID=UPI0038558AA6
MVTTYAQAQETAEDWINAGVPRSLQREVRVREFDLGYVCWAVDGSEHAGGTGSSPRLVIARDSGVSMLWPPLPINEVVRQFEELYGTPAEPNPAGAAKPVRGAVEATSFLLSPPQWLQDAGAAAVAAEAAQLSAPPVPPAPVPPAPVPPASVAAAAGPGEGPDHFPPAGTPAPGTPVPPPFPVGGPSTPVPGVPVPPPGPVSGMPVPPPMPAPVGATPPFPVGAPSTPVPGTPVPPDAPAPSIDYAPTMLATDGPPGLMGLPGAPGTPAQGVQLGRSGPTAPPPPPPNDLLPSSGGPAPVGLGRSGPTAPPPPPPNDLLPPGGGPVPGPGGRGGPGAPPPPAPAELRGDAGAPLAPPAAPASEAAAVAYQATQLAPAIELPPTGGPATPPFPPGPQQGAPFQAPPPFPGPPQGAPPQAPGPFPGAPVPPPQPGPGFPPPGPGPAPAAPLPPPGVPTIGPGTTAVVNYRAPDGSERSLVMTSEPGTPHPEWKALQELRRIGVPADQVLEVHTDLELCDLPGGYCARMVKASWPNARISHTAPYGRDTAARQAGMAVLSEHVEQLHQLVSAPPRPRTQRVPLPPPGSVPPLPPMVPQQLAAELGQLFGPGVFRFEQRAVARQGVPDAVAQTLMWVGLPREFPPFFWAQAQEGRPIPTLAELAAERGLPPGPDFGGYLVLGNDYGRQLCVQYGTAAVVAVDIENPAEPPRFVNTGVPEFVRCLTVLARMWHLRHGLTPEQAGRWTTDLQAQLLAADPAAVHTPESWWAVLVEQLWDGLL